MIRTGYGAWPNARREGPLARTLCAHSVRDPGKRNGERGAAKRFHELRVLGIKPSNFIKHCRVMLFRVRRNGSDLVRRQLRRLLRRYCCRASIVWRG